MKNKTRIVAVGISGGVDSAMAAWLLMQQDYEVIGLTMSIWDESIPLTESTKSGCFGPGEKDDLLAAEQLCAKLGIKHHIVRLQGEYKENVLSYFCATYREGKTPNPCLMCNARMKFGLLPLKAREQGINFDLFATGHYVRVRYDAAWERYQLLRALDKSKDQSYFLSFLAQSQLKNLVFPLGDKTKSEIKQLAKEVGFAELAHKKESQDFLESDDIRVLFPEGSYSPGEIVDHHGKRLGTHKGLINYTIGQRRNLGVSGLPEPYFVIELDAVANKVVLGPKSLLSKDECLATAVNWLSLPPQTEPFKASAKIRLQHEAAECLVIPLDGNRLQVKFTEPQLSITPGQGLVIYSDDLLIAGGIID
jgi:tRNA-specific 2-thiouridylase